MSTEIYAEIDWADPIDEEPEVPDDERKGLPSASEYPRIWACPGYLQLKAKLPKRKRTPGPDAISGQRIHAALAEPTEAKLAELKLTDEEQQVFEWCGDQWNKLIERFFTMHGLAANLISEQRIFWEDKFSGQFDRTAIEIDGFAALMADFKTGRIAVPGVDTNLQMRAYAVLLFKRFPHLEKIYVAVIQPWVSKDPLVAVYERADIMASTAELEATLKNAAAPNARRIPGAHCKHCPCRADCEEARAVPMKLARVEPTTLATNDDIAAFLNLVALAETVIKAVKEEAKIRIRGGQEIPGWELAPGRMMQAITDPEKIYARVSKLGVTQAGFMSAVKIQKGSLKDAIKAATNLKGKGLEEQLTEVLDGCVTESQADGSLKKTDPSTT